PGRGVTLVDATAGRGVRMADFDLIVRIAEPVPIEHRPHGIRETRGEGEPGEPATARTGDACLASRHESGKRPVQLAASVEASASGNREAERVGRRAELISEQWTGEEGERPRALVEFGRPW